MTSLLIGLRGTELSDPERIWLQHPAVAGAIVFARNLAGPDALSHLCGQIRTAAPDALITVDQEGGRVQRLQQGHTRLPPLARIGELYERNRAGARRAARLHAEIMAVEVLSAGLDLSFAPVADLARGNLAIGDRAFHADPQVCAELAAVYLDRMQACGMAATLKHFPGHGSVLADSHHDRALDQRLPAAILEQDLLPFAVGVLAGARAVMMAHVEYPQCSSEPAGYSRYWIYDVLRAGLGFRGVVISDDIGMVAGGGSDSVARRLQLHADAGCDLILVCDPGQVEAALAASVGPRWRVSSSVRRLRGRLRRPLQRERERATWARRAERLAGLLV